MRLLVYTDYPFERAGSEVFAGRAFSLFLALLGERVDVFGVAGRLGPPSGAARYSIGVRTRFVALPWYGSLTEVGSMLRSSLRSFRVFWRSLDDFDTVWLLGPHPLAIGFALLALLRRRRVVLGVRQDLPTYMERRHPGRRSFRAAALALEAVWRVLARFCDTVVVGPALARKYRRSRALLDLVVSLVPESALAEPRTEPIGRPVEILTVGRIDEEKNPLLLADVAAELERRRPGEFRLTICGEGPMEAALDRRVAALGATSAVERIGYVPFGEELLRTYRSADVFLHVSWTEGFPQVLIEAAASALPIIATDVGGVVEGLGGAAVFIHPGDASIACDCLEAIRNDPALAVRLRRSASEWAGDRTSEASIARLVQFIEG